MKNLPLVLQLLVLLAGVVSADEGLHPGDDLGQFVITHLLKLTQHSGLEEDLCVFCVCVCVCARARGGFVLNALKQRINIFFVAHFIKEI